MNTLVGKYKDGDNNVIKGQDWLIDRNLLWITATLLFLVAPACLIIFKSLNGGLRNAVAYFFPSYTISVVITAVSGSLYVFGFRPLYRNKPDLSDYYDFKRSVCELAYEIGVTLKYVERTGVDTIRLRAVFLMHSYLNCIKTECISHRPSTKKIHDEWSKYTRLHMVASKFWRFDGILPNPKNRDSLHQFETWCRNHKNGSLDDYGKKWKKR